MNQCVLPFKYESSKSNAGLTALAGLPTFFELAFVLGMVASIEKHLGVRRSQGWTDVEMVMSLILLNLAGGEHVEDLDGLEADEGISEVMRKIRGHRLSRKERRKREHRWRKKRERTFASRSAGHRYLKEFHDEEQEKLRKEALAQGTRAFIPEPNQHLQGLVFVNRDLAAVIHGKLATKKNPLEVATLDMDATLNYCNKEEALHCYKGPKAYQPLNTWWAELQLMLHTEFRDGNVPAGHEQLRVFKEAMDCLPSAVKVVRLRSDTAGYQHDLLKYCAEGKNGLVRSSLPSPATSQRNSRRRSGRSRNVSGTRCTDGTRRERSTRRIRSGPKSASSPTRRPRRRTARPTATWPSAKP